MSVDAILKEIGALSPAERAELKARIAEQFPDPELPSELKAELDRRLADADANPGAAVPWEEVYRASLKRTRR